MKKLIALSAICFLISTSIFAQASSSLNLRMLNRSQFSFNLDGMNYPIAQSQHLENLRPGKHFLSVSTTQWRHHGFVTKVVYRGSVYIEPCTETFISITNGALLVDNVVALYPQNNHWNSNGFAHQQNHNYQGQYGANTNQYAPCEMSDYEFSNLLRSLNNASFESTKLSIANTVLHNNFFTTNQVRQILEQFSFESTKLDFAKSAYSKTIDKNNYYSLSDSFSFNSSTIALNNFIVSR
ncbi:MAG: DUF4476 domain-containing protein [Bacteroidetes bacterium]|nr:DUF4476 domain-containing protein [Bacteroidota bacterium]